MPFPVGYKPDNTGKPRKRDARVARVLVGGEEVAARDLWKTQLKDIEFFRKTCKDQARELGVSEGCVFRWKQAMTISEWEEVRDHFREGYAKFAPMVDFALIRKATQGEMKAVELFYQRMENWNPKTGMDISVTRKYGEMDQRELMKAIVGTLTPSEREMLAAKKEEVETQVSSEIKQIDTVVNKGVESHP